MVLLFFYILLLINCEKIDNINDLNTLQTCLNNNNECIINSDININSFTTINEFSGILDSSEGNKFTINLSTNKLFKTIKNGSIRNVKIVVDNIAIASSSEESYGVLADYMNEVELYNIEFTVGDISTTNYKKIGLLSGYVSGNVNVTKTDVTVNKISIKSDDFIDYGGLFGFTTNNIDLSSISFKVTTNVNIDAPIRSFGGLIGEVLSLVECEEISVIFGSSITFNIKSGISTNNIGFIIGRNYNNYLYISNANIEVNEITINDVIENLQYGSVGGSIAGNTEIKSIKIISNGLLKITQSNSASASVAFGGLIGESIGILTLNTIYIKQNSIQINADNVYLGGISSSSKKINDNNLLFSSEFGEMTITSKKVIFGGFLGSISNSPVTIQQSYSIIDKVTLNVQDCNIGGLIGEVKSQATIISSFIIIKELIINPYESDISGNCYIGGMIGYLTNNIEIKSSYIHIDKLNILYSSIIYSSLLSKISVSAEANIIGSKYTTNTLVTLEDMDEQLSLVNKDIIGNININTVYINIESITGGIINDTNSIYSSQQYIVNCDNTNIESNNCDISTINIGENEYFNKINDNYVIGTIPNYISNNQFTPTSSILEWTWNNNDWAIPINGYPFLHSLSISKTVCNEDNDNNLCINSIYNPILYCNDVKYFDTCKVNNEINGKCIKSICYPTCENTCSYSLFNQCIDGGCIKTNEVLGCSGNKPCNDGEWCDRNECKFCPSECKLCNKDNECTSCETGYLLNNGKCESNCKENQYEIDGICEECPIKCATCSSSEICLTCNTNYIYYNNQCYDTCPEKTYYDSDKKSCNKCSDNCNKCKASTKLCEECDSGYILYGGSCITTCPDGYIISNNRCVACKKGTYKLNNECVTTCTGNKYGNDETKTCEDCDSSCLKCSSIATNCTECVDGLYLQTNPLDFSGQCIEKEECPSNTFASSDYTCKSCPVECTSCRSEAICTSCDYMYVLERQKCVFFLNSTANGSSLLNIKAQIYIIIILLLLNL